jgi:hypothetical protein
MFVNDPAPYEILQVGLGALASAVNDTRVSIREADAVAPLLSVSPAHNGRGGRVSRTRWDAAAFCALDIQASKPTASLAVSEAAEAVFELSPSVLFMGSDLQPESIQPQPDPPTAGMAPLEFLIRLVDSQTTIAGNANAVLRHVAGLTEAANPELKDEPRLEPVFEAVPLPDSYAPSLPMAARQPMPMWAAASVDRYPIASPVNPVIMIPPIMRLVMGRPSSLQFSLREAPLRPTEPVAAQPARAAEVREPQWLKLWSIRVPAPPEHLVDPLTASVRLAGGCRYATQTNAGPVMVEGSQGPVEFAANLHALEYPTLTHYDVRQALSIEFQPKAADLINLRGRLEEIRAYAPAEARICFSEIQLEHLGGRPCIPGSSHQPLAWEAEPPELVAEAPEAPAQGTPSSSTFPSITAQKTALRLLLHAVGEFWKNAPRDLRVLIIAIPVLLALAFHPSLPKLHVSAVRATGPMQTRMGEAVNSSRNNLRLAVSSRAAVALDEDFRFGLDEWRSPGGIATEWSFDANDFVHPGSLALYSPSLNLTDYQLQFLALIDKKALSWVVRAADFDNYYVVKLVVSDPGPLTTLGLTRYAVINGKAQDRVDAVVPLTARPDMIYRVKMDIHDDNFSVAVQGQLADAWSEPRLKRGGIGFFCARGELSRVRWLQVTHQYDMLGRLSSFLARYDLAATNSRLETTTNTNSNQNGSWKP